MLNITRNLITKNTNKIGCIKRFINNNSANSSGSSYNRLKFQEQLNIERARINEWRSKHTMQLLLAGGATGGLICGAGVYYYIHNSPGHIEQFIVSKASSAFARALNFEARKKIFFGLPDINVPIPKSPSDFIQANNATNSSNLDNLESWSKKLIEGVKEMDSKWILTAKKTMREELIKEALTIESFNDRLNAIQEILPPSFEKNEIISDQLEKHLKENDYIKAEYLEKYPPSAAAESAVINNKLLIAAITFFPGSINKLVLYLTDEIDLDNVMQYVKTQVAIDNNLSEKTGKQIETALALLKEQFVDLTENSIIDNKPLVQAYILQTSLMNTIRILPEMSINETEDKDEMTPYELYCKAIEEDLLAPLRKDARITERILEQVKRVFLALPPKLQARILLRAIRHPLARNEDISEVEQATIVKDMLSSGGVVAVKLAQVLAEDPKVPMNYRTLLGSLRDDNEPMSVTAFWHAIPLTVRSQIDYLGPILGTGSVKQVHVGKFYNRDRAVAVLRSSVEDEALASISALEASDELRPVAQRLGRLVFGEFNLFGEGEALGEFANTQIGKHSDFRVVRVLHHSPKCLVEAIAKGKTISDVLDKPDGGSKEFKEKVKKKLVEYHRAVFEAFVEDGFIHSDIHLANAMVDEQSISSSNDENEISFVLFDVGQMDRIGFLDTKAVLWVLGAVSSEERRITFKDVALNNLVKVCSLQKEQKTRIANISRSYSKNDADILARKKSRLTTSNYTMNDLQSLSEEEQLKFTRKLIDEAFVEACSPFEDGSLPDQKQAFLLFLRACETRGVLLPHAAFSVAKMIDSMLSQCLAYDLDNVVEEQIEKFLKKKVGWGELTNILYNNYTFNPKKIESNIVQKKPL